MKAHYKTRDGRLVFEIQGETVKDLFRGISQLQDVFDADSICGMCQSANVRFRTRTIEDNDYYEMACMDFYAKLDFGQHKKGGTLFVKRKSPEGDWFPNGGWKKWERSSVEEK
jgi:hypothetical protein